MELKLLLSMGTGAYHHSRLRAFRSPQGAAPWNSRLRLALAADCRYSAAALVLTAPEGTSLRYEMAREQREDGCLFSAEIGFPEGAAGLWWYYFVLTDGAGDTLYYGGESGEGRLTREPAGAYQVTVYDPAFSTPAWFREGILYQIFPDRFYQGRDHTGDYAAYRRKGRRIRAHRDWYGPVCYEGEAPGEPYDPNDFFGGDLWGMIEKLPYLKELGVTCIYLNPVFESPSNHRYNTADYRKADAILGGGEALAALSEAAYRVGVQLMLDGVFSHTGDDSRYFNKYGRYADLGAYQSPRSPYYRWYRFGEFPNGYASWWGFPTLPEVNENDPSYRDFVFGEGDSLIRYWAREVTANWRLDVADELPDDFIRDFRRAQKAIDPDSVLLGEVWEDASTKEAYGVKRQYVFGAELDSVMNYPFRDAVLGFFTGGCTAPALHHRLETLREHYPKPFWYACMNLLSTHDSVRAITVLSGAPGRDDLSQQEQAEYRPSPEALALGKKRFMLATALQMALPGVPSIYYGDEAGMTGMADPFNRGTYPWGREDKALLEAVKRLCKLRSRSQALKSGFCRMAAVGDDVFAVLRFTTEADAFGKACKPETVLLLVNRGQSPQNVELGAEQLLESAETEELPALSGTWKDLLGNQEVWAQEGIQCTLPPHGLLLLKKT